MPMNEYGEIVRNNKYHPSRKSNVIITIVIIIIVLGIIPQYQNYQNEKINNLKKHLINNEYRAYHSYTGNLLTNYCETWKLIFNTETNVDYYYIDQAAWENEAPIYQGTYNYSVTYSIFGEYKIKINKDTFLIEADDNGVPSTNSWSARTHYYTLHDWPVSNDTDDNLHHTEIETD